MWLDELNLTNEEIVMTIGRPIGGAMSESRGTFGNFIRSLRLSLNLNQTQVGHLAGISQNYVSALELGIVRYPGETIVMSLARALKCSPEELRRRIPARRVAEPVTAARKLIRARRVELGLSLAEFASRMGMTPAKARYLETSRCQHLRLRLVRPLSTILNFSPSVLAPFVDLTRKEAESEFGRLVRAGRLDNGMTDRDLARKLGVTAAYVSQIEVGKASLSQSHEFVVRLALILGFERERLLAARSKRKFYGRPGSPLGAFLVARRLGLCLSQREAGERAEVTPSTISGIETGRIRPSKRTLGKIARALACEIPPELVSTKAELIRPPRTA